MLQLGNRSNRAGVVAAVLSAFVPLAGLPHVFEDVAEGVFAGFGLGTLAAGLFVGGALTIQLLGAFAALRESRIGYVIILLAAVIWIVLAVYDHPGAFTPGDFREGMVSRVAIWAIVGVQGIAGLAALSALRSTRGSSFSGTGTYTSSGTSYGS